MDQYSSHEYSCEYNNWANFLRVVKLIVNILTALADENSAFNRAGIDNLEVVEGLVPVQLPIRARVLEPAQEALGGLALLGSVDHEAGPVIPVVVVSPSRTKADGLESARGRVNCEKALLDVEFVDSSAVSSQGRHAADLAVGVDVDFIKTGNQSVKGRLVIRVAQKANTYTQL